MAALDNESATEVDTSKGTGKTPAMRELSLDTNPSIARD